MHGAKLALVVTLFGVGGGLAITSSFAPAHAAPATKLLVHCCEDGVVGEPQVANIEPVDDEGLNDGTFTGTVTFSTDFTENFTITPHDAGAGNEHEYTFKPGDINDASFDGKDFIVVFHEPGTGQFDATSPGLETVHDNQDGDGHAMRNNDFTIRPAQGGGGGGGGTTTTAPATTTTTVATTTTMARTATTTTPTTTPVGVPPTIRARPDLPMVGAYIEEQTRAGVALLLVGALLVVTVSERAWRLRRRPLLAAGGPTHDEVVYQWIMRVFSRLVGTGAEIQEPDDRVRRREAERRFH